MVDELVFELDVESAHWMMEHDLDSARAGMMATM